MDPRLPYYMAYPMPLLYDDEKIERNDYEYMKSQYPMTAKKVLLYVEEECERMEYETSMIYDEYPDQLQIRLMCNRIYDKVKVMEDSQEGADREGWLKDLIQVMLFQELFQRRCKHRKCRRRFY